MANSITLSAGIINALSAKITAGTATAEEIVLYTTGLQRLQEGNDFEATVIGLSQSAVDAIDAANSQFQTDSATAVSNFSTSTGTAVTDFTTASNTAITDINTARTNLETAATDLANVVSGLPTASTIETAIDTGLNYVAPNQRIAFWKGYGQSGFVRMAAFDHDFIMQDEQMYNTQHYGNGSYFASGEGYGGNNFIGALDSDGDASTNNFHHMRATGNSYNLGANAVSFYDQYNKFGKYKRFATGGSDTAKMEQGVVCGSYEQDVFLFRDGQQYKATTNYSPGTARAWDRFFVKANANNQISDEERGIHLGYTGFLWPTPGLTAKGLCSYNTTTNKLLSFDVATTQNDAFPIVAEFAGTHTLRRIAYGLETSTFGQDYDATATLTNMIVGTNGLSGKPSNSGTEANYRGKPVLCDNNNIVLVQAIQNGPLYVHRWVPNGTNDNWLSDFNTTMSRNGTVYGAEGSGYSSVAHQITLDGKYVCVYAPYYYYGGGMTGYFIRVTDGKILKFTAGTNQYQQWIVPVHKHKFYFSGRNFNGNNNHWIMDMEYIFGLQADGADISSLFTTQVAHPTTSQQMGSASAIALGQEYATSTGWLATTIKMNPLDFANLV